jgi:hypothetical protein
MKVHLQLGHHLQEEGPIHGIEIFGDVELKQDGTALERMKLLVWCTN